MKIFSPSDRYSWGDVASFWVVGGRLLRVVHVDYAFSVSALMAGLLGDDHGLFCRHWWVSSSAKSSLLALMAVLLGDDDGSCSRCLYITALSLSKISICGTGEQIILEYLAIVQGCQKGGCQNYCDTGRDHHLPCARLNRESPQRELAKESELRESP